MFQEVYSAIKTPKDIMVFNVVEINLDNLTESFFYWSRSNEKWVIYKDYVSIFPQCYLRSIKPNLYKITFEFHGYNQIIESTTYELSVPSVKYILNNLLNPSNYRHKL